MTEALEDYPQEWQARIREIAKIAGVGNNDVCRVCFRVIKVMCMRGTGACSERHL